jgi:diguanylate cyclase (GGDEF)-like protein/PAS domain S-box-containing protein
MAINRRSGEVSASRRLDLHEWDDGRLWRGVYLVRSLALVAFAAIALVIGASTVTWVIMFVALPINIGVGLHHRRTGSAGWVLPADQYISAGCLLIDPRIAIGVAVCNLVGAVNAAVGTRRYVVERSILAGGAVTLAAAAVHRDLTLALFGPTITFSAFALTRFVSYIQRRAMSANARFEELLDGLNAFVIENDVNTGRVLYMNHKARELLGGFKRGDGDMLSFVHPDDRQRVIEEVQRARKAARSTTFELRVQRRDGTYIQMEQRVTLSNMSTARRQRNVLIDITSRKKAERELQHRATHDALTDLANRRLYRDRLDQAIARSRRNSRPFAVLLLDVDKFKQINDHHGHAAGDEVLQATADRLLDAVRGADTVARLGGDEFALLLEETAHDEAVVVARRCIEAISQPVGAAGTIVIPQASIGLVIAPHGGSDADTLMRHADIAMYQAKRRGGGFAVYDGSVTTMEMERVRQ